jgi:hypothetical protein
MKKVRDAVPLRNDHIVALEELESTMLQDSLVQWRTAVELWEKDSNAPNPFKATRRSMYLGCDSTDISNSLIPAITEQAARLEISKEVEAEDPFATTTAVAEVHASIMISMGMQLEDDQ